MNYNYPGYSGGYKPTTPQYPQWAQPPTPIQSFPQVRPVTSLDEVKAYPIDFDGSVFYFADMANKRIYTKQINIDGTASINLYELKPLIAEPQTNIFITRQEFEQAISQLKEMYNKPKENELQAPTQPKVEFQF